MLVEVWAKPGLAQSTALKPNRAVRNRLQWAMSNRGHQGLRRKRSRFCKGVFVDSMCFPMIVMACSAVAVLATEVSAQDDS